MNTLYLSEIHMFHSRISRLSKHIPTVMLRFPAPMLNSSSSFITKHGFRFSFPLIRTPKLSFVAAHNASSYSIPSLSELDDAVKGYIFGEKKATEVAHLLWKHVVKKGDVVVDATCGNGNDTLAMAKLVKDDLGKGCVYGLDIQEDAIKNTSHLLDLSLDPVERTSVKLFSICHSRMSEVLPKNSSVRLVAFNLGYLPGGDKAIITKSGTTLQALEAAKEILVPGGAISVVAYVGHPGGREEYEIVQAFASELRPESWSCSHIQMLNKSTAPVLVFMVKR